MSATVQAPATVERLLQESWTARWRRASRHEVTIELAAGALFLLAAAALWSAAPPGAADLGTAGLLLAAYVAVARVEFPIGHGWVVPTQLVLLPMLVLLPPALVPPLVAAGLVLSSLAGWRAGAVEGRRIAGAPADSWHAIGPAAVLVAAGSPALSVADAGLVGAAFAAGCVVDLLTAVLRERALGSDVGAGLQARVMARVWAVDLCLAPVGFAVGLVARDEPAAVLLVLPLATLLWLLARDRTERIAEAYERLEQASTDALTGLGNRRKLLADLSELTGGDGPEEPRVLVLFDLDGFKRYNDAFGHLAGDAMLARLAGKLAAAVGSDGEAYRLGGDEFCAVLPVAGSALEESIERTARALSDRGEEFAVTASFGAVLIPHEAGNPSRALQLADERMYATKRGRGSGFDDQTREVLMRIMQAKQPRLDEHAGDVASLAIRVAERLGVRDEELDVVARAAELHDIGKVGIPDAILDKPGPLDADDWSLMHQHTVLGERILGASPALRPVARVVRATHERWDGGGYPDRLRGESIPLAARIVAVCDAYEAMTSDRPYRRALGAHEARAELRRHAGGQFDRHVVEAFFGVIDAQDAGRADVAPRVERVTEHLRGLLEPQAG